ncbi:AraC family transcriptional regulator [Puia sp.]|jgi:AraC-like DNA-binding protein|uniref:AraC family transcriptional regulator n=1 Tax=Puia sp. TaxID=2045100 RepID=UPI002F42F7CE
MYFTQLPDHTKPGFNEQLHFSRFQNQNIIFNAWSKQAGCDNHVGCLSFKTVLAGEECYGIGGRQIAVRPGQFLILNDDQPYSCRIHKNTSARILSLFFKKEFAREVFADTTRGDAASIDDPDPAGKDSIEFFQTLYPVEPELQRQLNSFLLHLDIQDYNGDATDEYFIFFLRHLIRTHRSQLTHAARVNALKPVTRREIFKRLCIAKDLLQSSYGEPLDLRTIAKAACLSTPQLVRQFRAAFNTTPHRYLVNLRLDHAARLLKTSTLPVLEIAGQCGFEDPSAFCRAFKTAHGLQPERYRKHQ